MDPNGPLYGPQFVRKSKLMDPLWTPLFRLISKHLCIAEGFMDPFYTPPRFPQTDSKPAFAGYRLFLHTVAHCCLLLHTGQFRT